MGKNSKDWTPVKFKKVLWSDKLTFPVKSNEIGKISCHPGCDQLDPTY